MVFLDHIFGSARIDGLTFGSKITGRRFLREVDKCFNQSLPKQRVPDN